MEIKSLKVIAQTPFVELIDATYINTKNNESHWAYARRTSNRKAVMIVPFVGDKILTIKEFRVPINDYEWSFPAGLIDNDEAIEIAAKRELKEETNLEMGEIISSSPFVYNSAGITDEAIAILFVKASGEIGTNLNESSEEIEPHLMTKEQVKELLLDRTKKFSAKAWVILAQFAGII